MRAQPVDRRVIRLGWVLLALTVFLVIMSFIGCKPIPPDDDSHHRESPSTMKRY